MSTFGNHGVPYGLHDSLCTLREVCSMMIVRRQESSVSGFPLPCLKDLHTLSLHVRRSRNTRYGWVASPYPTGTFTLQDTPSFAWRANACNHVALARSSRRATPLTWPPSCYARGVCGNWRQRAEVTCIALLCTSSISTTCLPYSTSFNALSWRLSS